MIPYFEFRGKKSSDFGLIIKEGRSIKSSERSVDFINIPGRSGDLLSDNNRFTNYDDTYDCALLSNANVEQSAYAVRTWLQGQPGYGKLIDYNEPDYFRMATCINSLDVAKSLKDLGMVSVTFNCKPQRYRLDGDAIQTLTAPGTLTNPEPYESLPYIKIT